MLSFWAGGISSFSPCAREYRLLRRLKKTCMMLDINFNYDWFIGEGANCITPSQSFLMDENAFVIPFQ